MNSTVPIVKHPDWKTLYRAAILETDKSAVPKRVLAAEEAVTARAREVFYGNGDPDEQEELADALYALLAFKTAWQYKDAAQSGCSPRSVDSE